MPANTKRPANKNAPIHLHIYQKALQNSKFWLREELHFFNSILKNSFLLISNDKNYFKQKKGGKSFKQIGGLAIISSKNKTGTAE